MGFDMAKCSQDVRLSHKNRLQDNVVPFMLLYRSVCTYVQTQMGTLAGVAQWTEHQPAYQRVAGSIPSLGHMPGLWARSLVGGACERQPYIDVSLPLPSPLKKSLKIFLKNTCRRQNCEQQLSRGVDSRGNISLSTLYTFPLSNP